ncbi:hypothetical protein L9F63_001268, partial [Diploptera punctata]
FIIYSNYYAWMFVNMKSIRLSFKSFLFSYSRHQLVSVYSIVSPMTKLLQSLHLFLL